MGGGGGVARLLFLQANAFVVLPDAAPPLHKNIKHQRSISETSAAARARGSTMTHLLNSGPEGQRRVHGQGRCHVGDALGEFVVEGGVEAAGVGGILGMQERKRSGRGWLAGG